MGHPLSRFIEEDIDKLLSKIPLEAPETPIEMKEQPHDVMVEEIEQFKQKAKEFAEEIQDVAEHMERSYLVMQDKCTVNFKTETWEHDTTVHTVFVGTKDVVEILVEDTEELKQGPWKNQD